MMNVRVYANGASSGNPGEAGWAAVLLQPNGLFEISGSESNSTNNRMNIAAALNGLNAVAEPSRIFLLSDAKYLVNAFTAGWVHNWMRDKWRKANGTKVENVDLWRELVDAVQRHEEVVFKWLRGHNRDQYSQWADSLARTALTGRTTPLRACTIGASRGRSRDSNFTAVRF